MARLIPADMEKEITEITVTCLKDMQDAVGGLIEAVWHDTTGKKALLVNEEGIIIGLPINARASVMLGYPLFGDALEVSIPEEFN